MMGVTRHVAAARDLAVHGQRDASLCNSVYSFAPLQRIETPSCPRRLISTPLLCFHTTYRNVAFSTTRLSCSQPPPLVGVYGVYILCTSSRKRLTSAAIQTPSPPSRTRHLSATCCLSPHRRYNGYSFTSALHFPLESPQLHPLL